MTSGLVASSSGLVFEGAGDFVELLAGGLMCVGFALSVAVDVLRLFKPLKPSFSFVLLRFLGPGAQDPSSPAGEMVLTPLGSLLLRVFLSASSCC